MKILVVKTSSMGDVIHALPALTDAQAVYPDISFDWVVEERFEAIPTWHPAVDRVIPVAWRRWRKSLWSAETRAEIAAFRRMLKENQYDAIIDAQGLIKSAVISRLATGPIYGYDRHSIREPLASAAYHKRLSVTRQAHAVHRIRSLFALALGYDLPFEEPTYGLHSIVPSEPKQQSVILIHGTTWLTKHWPVDYWIELAQKILDQGYGVELCWGSDVEFDRSELIADAVPGCRILPKLDITAMAAALAGSRGAVAVDTGFAHLAVALDIPLVALYGPTDPGLSGVEGAKQASLSADFPCAPCHKRVCTFKGNAAVTPACFEDLTPDTVWQVFQQYLECA